jgi:hypothetical protein
MENEKARELKRPGEEARRPYERPSVTWEEDFQPYVFSTCTKMAGQGAGCNANKKS